MNTTWSKHLCYFRLLLLLAAGTISTHISFAYPVYQNATDFFTNVAGLLLRSQLNADLNHIQIYPTNQYTPALHRLLQVTANLYDATTNRGSQYPYFPTVFRPVFGTSGNEIFIAGYLEETGTNLLSRPWRNVRDGTPVDPDDNVFGIPIIIGARKGLPNFNELVLQNVVQVVRKLELVKASLGSTNIIAINQMFVIGVSNLVGVEAWNSYVDPYPRNLSIAWKNESRINLAIDASTIQTSNVSPPWFVGTTNPCTYAVTAGNWVGGVNRGYQAFIPKKPWGVVSAITLPNSAYPTFEVIGDSDVFVAGTNPKKMGITITNLFAFFILDTDSNRIVDAVSLYATNYFEVCRELYADLSRTSSPAIQRLWDTNVIGGGVSGTTVGMSNQIYVSLHAAASSAQEWADYNYDPMGTALSKLNGIMAFTNFLYTTNTLKLMNQTPFNPVRKMWQTTSWQVNDPLVHYRLDDLWDDANDTNHIYVVTKPYKHVVDLWMESNLGKLNRRYKPWAFDWTHGLDSPDPNDIEISVKDPSIISSDSWEFPIQPFPLANELGRVHRGTPWQTLYLKSKAAPMFNWARQTGAAFTPQTHPTNDWKLVSVLAPLLNTNAPSSQLCINETNPAAWGRVLDGTLVRTNDWDPYMYPFCSQLLMSSNSPQVSDIVLGINQARNTYPNTQFPGLGDVLSTAALSCGSPWVNWADPFLMPWGCFYDSDYEAIPEHILPLLKAGPKLSMMSAGCLSITGANGQAVVLEGSVDLNAWEPLATNIVDVILFYTDPAPASPWRFYRGRLVP